MATAPSSRQVIGSRVDATTYDDAVARILAAAGSEGGHVCCADAHMLVRARREAGLRAAMRAALLVCPDGAPVAWALRRLGLDVPGRVCGPDLAWMVLAAAERQGQAVAFYGGHPEAAATLQAVVRERHPRLQVVAAIAPPFRALEEQELAADLAALRQARIILVGLGCPKQELWMQAHGGALPGVVLLGIGAWFDFASGRVWRAPRWVQRVGMEWCFRIVADPRRLLLRYAWTVPVFLLLFFWQRLRRQ